MSFLLHSLFCVLFSFLFVLSYNVQVSQLMGRGLRILDKLIKLAAPARHFRFISFVLLLLNLEAARRFLEIYFCPCYIKSIIVGGLGTGLKRQSHSWSNVLNLNSNGDSVRFSACLDIMPLLDCQEKITWDLIRLRNLWHTFNILTPFRKSYLVT